MCGGKGLLDALGFRFGADERFKDGQDMPPVLHHALENVAQAGLALRFAVPLQEYGGWYLDIATKLLCGMTAQEEAVEKGRLTLREVELLSGFNRAELNRRRSHRKNAVYRNRNWRQVVLES
jgi:hypothetical protein